MKLLLTVAVALGLAVHAPARADAGADAAKAYALDTAGSTTRLSVGEKGKLLIAIKPLVAGWKVHPEAPLKITFQAPKDLGLARASLGRADAEGAKGEVMRFENAFSPTAAGSHQVVARVDFFICSDLACVKQTRNVSFPLDVS